MFKSLPFTPRVLKVTEARLNAVYAAAQLGLTGDALALKAGMLPSEFRAMAQVDPMVDLAVAKAKADIESELSQVLLTAAREGDAKIALEVLKHRHDWVAKQQLQVDVNQQISITQALEDARHRVIEGISRERPEDPTHAKSDTIERRADGTGLPPAELVWREGAA